MNTTIKIQLTPILNYKLQCIHYSFSISLMTKHSNEPHFISSSFAWVQKNMAVVLTICWNQQSWQNSSLSLYLSECDWLQQCLVIERQETQTSESYCLLLLSKLNLKVGFHSFYLWLQAINVSEGNVIFSYFLIFTIL